MTIATGNQLGPYEILAPLGAGGMGEVYRAKDPRLGRDVAIKVLPASFSADPDRLRRFEQEARAAGLLNHPNITAVYDIGTHEGAPYVVEELLEGETLRSLLAGGRLSQRKAIDYALQIAHGLAAAHEKGIVHRDLKPENLFVTNDGRVKILDFGLAKLTHAEEGSNVTSLPTATAGTEPGVVLGTLGYMSPEQVRGRPADPRSDIFSFGAILYEMLSGKRAFHGDSAADTMSAILKEDPPELSVTNQSISPGLERIVRHCLEKNPEQRFHSAHDLAFDLEALSGTSGQTGSLVSASGLRPIAWRQVRTRLAVAAGLLLAGILVGRFLLLPRIDPPTFQRLTFKRGNIVSARFAPDGQTVVFGAALGGNPLEIFSVRPGNPELTSLGLRNADVFAVSSKGEMAISLRERFLTGGGVGTLARAPLGGGAPRPVLDYVDYADWSPDGESLAVIRSAQGRNRVEFPIEKVLYSSPSRLLYVRVSPRGDRIAFAEGSSAGGIHIAVVDLAGKILKLSGPWPFLTQVAWSPSAREVWFSAGRKRGDNAVRAVDLSGRERVLLRIPDALTLHDVARDGRVLLERYTSMQGIISRSPGEMVDRDLSWLDGSRLAALSTDGRTLVFSELSDAGGAFGAVYLRRTDGSPAVRLGEGRARDLSRDGRWVLASAPGPQPGLLLLPTGTGSPRPIPLAVKLLGGEGAFFPSGDRIVFLGSEGGRSRLYAADLGGGRLRPIAPEGYGSTGNPISPDGKWIVLFRDWSEDLFLQSLEGGDPRPIPGTRQFDPMGWSADGRFLFVKEMGRVPLRISRVDPFTGRREPWKELVPPDAASVVEFPSAMVTPDGRGYAYSFARVLSSDLFLVEGLR